MPFPRGALHRGVLALLLLGGAALVVVGVGLGRGGWTFGRAGAHADRLVTIELRSWIVAGRGRHLFAEIKPAQGVPWPADLPLIVEYWSAAIRDGYEAPADESRAVRITRMPLGHRVVPSMVRPPDNRLEATYSVSLQQAKELAKDRMFENRYFLLGPNSTSGLRGAFNAAGLELPQKALAGRGVLGEFPGVDLSPGREVPRARWGMYGIGAATGAKASGETTPQSAPDAERAAHAPANAR